MQFKVIWSKLILFLRELYRVWFPWLDLVILAFLYFFLWGEYLNPYRQYQLIGYGKTANGKISGEDGLYAYSENPRMRDFLYSFKLPNGKIIKSKAHTLGIDEVDRLKGKFPVKAEISYLADQPEINWVKSNLPDDLADLLKRNLIFGTSFILFCYLLSMILIRLNVLEWREEKRIKKLEAEGYTLVKLPTAMMN